MTKKTLRYHHDKNCPGEKVDKETYDVVVCENKVILKSQETQTLVALNLAITE